MSAPVCSSEVQCKLNGIAGTAVAVSLAALAYVVVDLLLAGASVGLVAWLMLVPMGPVVMSVGYAGLMRVWRQPMGWAGLGITAGGAVWAVVMLNMLERL